MNTKDLKKKLYETKSLFLSKFTFYNLSCTKEHTLISAAPPNIYPPISIPINITALSHPFSTDDNERSQAEGSTKDTT